MKQVEWCGPIPKTCDLCGTAIKEVFIDGRLKIGHWAIMCPLCYVENGVGLGEGYGQRFEQDEHRYIKTAD